MESAEDDALVMYLVVRQRTTRSFAELALAAALAARRCARHFRTDERWRDGFDEWWRHSFRKVCLRAEPREWGAVRDLDHERVGDVACLPPVRRSARDRVLVRMQALSAEAGALPEPGELGGITLVVAADLAMSSGKTLAQIGHAALMADLDPAFDADLRVVGAGGETWRRLGRDAVAVVRDGGLTELEPGSETVLVLERARGRGLESMLS